MILVLTKIKNPWETPKDVKNVVPPCFIGKMPTSHQADKCKPAG